MYWDELFRVHAVQAPRKSHVLGLNSWCSLLRIHCHIWNFCTRDLMVGLTRHAHCKKAFVILTIAFVTRVATVD